MFKYLHNGTNHTDTSKVYMEALGLDDAAIESVLNQKTYEENQQPKILSTQMKKQGIEINGYQVSLSKDNSDGLVSIKAGYDLVGDAIFPTNFIADNASGTVSIRLENLEVFTGFALQFLAARNALFN
jgi:hypothetical protein